MFIFFNVVGGHNSSRLPTTALATIKDLDPEGDKNILIRIYTQNYKKKRKCKLDASILCQFNLFELLC